MHTMCIVVNCHVCALPITVVMQLARNVAHDLICDVAAHSKVHILEDFTRKRHYECALKVIKKCA